MDKLTLGLMLTCAALIGCVASTVIMPEVRAGASAAPASASSVRWEYKCLKGKESPESLALAANVLGAQRWEMVAASVPTTRSLASASSHWCFKRARATPNSMLAPLPPLPEGA